MVKKNNVVLGELKIEYVPIESLKPNSYNPNRQNEQQFELLMRSMEEDGFTQPVIVNSKDLTIVDGEHRWRAALSIGMKEIPVVKVQMNPEQMRIATLRHNRARGEEDMELAADVLKDLAKMGAIDFAADSLMLDQSELDKMLLEINEPDNLNLPEFDAALDPFKSKDEKGNEILKNSHEVVSSTEEASNAQRAQRKALDKAKNQEEVFAAQKDLSVFKLTLSFTGEEADIMKKALGINPAEAILELCLKEFNQMKSKEIGEI